jgi:hypothetical protein
MTVQVNIIPYLRPRIETKYLLQFKAFNGLSLSSTTCSAPRPNADLGIWEPVPCLLRWEVSWPPAPVCSKRGNDHYHCPSMGAAGDRGFHQPGSLPFCLEQCLFSHALLLSSWYHIHHGLGEAERPVWPPQARPGPATRYL